MEKSKETSGGPVANATKSVGGSSSINVNLQIDTDEGKIIAVVNKNAGSFADNIAERIAGNLYQSFMNRLKGGS